MSNKGRHNEAERGADEAQCSECERLFDLRKETDVNEWLYGHDCEAAEWCFDHDRVWPGTITTDTAAARNAAPTEGELQ